MHLRWLLSLTLAAQWLAPGIGQASVQLLCAKDAAVHRSCCCENGVRAQHPCTRVESPDCCHVQPGADRAASRADAPPVAAPVLVAVAGVALFAPPSSAAGSGARFCGGAVGPPIFLRNCSILR